MRKFIDLGEPPSFAHRKHLWWRLFLITLLTMFFYAFMEWMFFVTKPSFMDVMSLWKKIDVLFTTNFFLFLLWLPFFGLLWGLSYLPGLSKKWYIFLYTADLIPAAILAITTLLLVDNFTYTVFQFGVVSTHGFSRIVYTILTLIVLALWFRWVVMRLKLSSESTHSGRFVTPSVLGITLIALSAVLTLPKLGSLNNLMVDNGIGSGARYPNIILIGGDGISALSTSLYGYERDTTPHLRQLAEESLLAENAFTNSAKSSGSVISMLTGKLPTNTRVVYPPDILRNSDSYQHLPGILRSIGYRTVEISIAHYIDAYTLNLRDGFDVVNDRSIDQAGFQIFAQSSSLQELGYFLSVLVERVSDRLLHIFFIREMSNPYQDVTTSKYTVKDLTRIRKTIKEVGQAGQPVFVHVHLIGTHGDVFSPERQVFSSGHTQDAPWMTDFYDDAILEFDSYFGELKSNLAEMGVLENTVIILYSDHGQNSSTDQRVPLLIRFPNGEYSGRISSNVQNLDIAPTILDYMGLPVPEWMEGSSLLAGERDPLRPIFSVGVSLVKPGEHRTMVQDLENIGPPFYQFGYLQTVVCQNWYAINLIDYEWEQGVVAGHTAPCDAEALPDVKIVQSWMIGKLANDSFDISELQEYYATLDSE
jgi:hypothetical protein